MAQRVITQLVSDLSGAEITDGGGKSVSFGYNGVDYRIDLTNKEADKFQSDIQKYLDAATRVSGRRRSSRASGAAVKPDNKAIRQWANKNGFSLGDRGRIPTDVTEAYEAAHTETK